MIIVIFEVWPSTEGESEYMRLAGTLLPEVKQVPGFLSIERFRSLQDPRKILSLSTWRDEESVTSWRNGSAHREAQTAGRTGVITDYRLRVAKVSRDYGLNERAQAPKDSNKFHSK